MNGKEQPLTEEQKDYAAQASTLVPTVIIYWQDKMRCLRHLFSTMDLESAAMLACVRAARTYDPKRSTFNAYFQKAITHALIRESQRAARHYRYGLASHSLSDVGPLADDKCGRADAVWQVVEQMSDEDRAWIEGVVCDGLSISGCRREFRRSWETAANHLRVLARRLLEECEDDPAFVLKGRSPSP